MKSKLTTCEKRALELCNQLNRYDGGSVQIEWKRSAMYGYNPSIMFHGGKCCNVSGCGYDKKSTALAECLRFLFPVESEPYYDVWKTGGCGDSSTMATLAKHWLEHALHRVRLEFRRLRTDPRYGAETNRVTP